MSSFSKLRYLAAVLLFVSTGSKSQNIDKHFVSNLQQRGVLYFILPQSGFATQQKNLTYDITYLSKTDTATFNFSVNGKQLLLIDTLVLNYKEQSASVPVKKLFIESKKKEWVARYSANIAYSDLQLFFDSEMQSNIVLKAKTENIAFACKDRQWKKICAINKKIFQVINYNA